MSELSSAARAALEEERADDEPTAADEERVRRALLRSLVTRSVVSEVSRFTPNVRVGSKRVGSKRAAEMSRARRDAGFAPTIMTAMAMAASIALGIALDRSLLRAPAVTAQIEATQLAAGAPSSAAADNPECPPPPACPEAVSRAPSPQHERIATPSNHPKQAVIEGAGGGPESAAAAEARLLGEVDVALKDERPEDALALLDTAGAQPGKGELGDARAAARAIASCKSGSAAEHARIVEQFDRDNPGSPRLDRVRAACSAPPRVVAPILNTLPFDTEPTPEQGGAPPTQSGGSIPFSGPIND